jgi:hypothetical protein
MFYKAYKIIIDAKKDTTKIILVLKLFNVIKLPFKLKEPSRNHLQKGVLLPLIIFFYFS